MTKELCSLMDCKDYATIRGFNVYNLTITLFSYIKGEKKRQDYMTMNNDFRIVYCPPSRLTCINDQEFTLTTVQLFGRLIREWDINLLIVFRNYVIKK